MKEKLDAILKATLQRCFRQEGLRPVPLPDYVIEIPNNPAHGHFATNLPLALASSQKRNPRQIADVILGHLQDEEGVLEKVEVAGPGFLNFTICDSQWHTVLSLILQDRDSYGKSEAGGGQRCLVEFVSANPTGPLHLGHGRGAALGDTLCRILSFCGYRPTREFYINDAGQQVRILGESIFSRWKQQHDPEAPFPENGYRGEYVVDLAKAISEGVELEGMSRDEAVAVCAEKGKQIMLQNIKRDLERFRVTFEEWSSESDLYKSGQIEKALDSLHNQGYLYETGGALWIRSSQFGDDKDRVIRKRDGDFTYFASDIAYHLEKHRRGFEKAINIWGADHHGYVPRLKAALSANGLSEGWLSVMLIQMVKLWRGNQEVKMSKRAGDFVTLDELLEEVGVDAVRFIFLTKSHDSTLDVDIELVKKQESENPVYYVQYAHARICSIFRKAAAEGVPLPDPEPGLLRFLELDEEMALVRQMAEFPPLLMDICKTLEPHRLTYYLHGLAASFHRYFNLGNKSPEYRIVGRDERSRARLLLAEAVRTVIANGLGLLGVSTPERM
jgi:arginyl-tRNA synthetase